MITAIKSRLTGVQNKPAVGRLVSAIMLKFELRNELCIIRIDIYGVRPSVRV